MGKMMIMAFNLVIMDRFLPLELTAMRTPKMLPKEDGVVTEVGVSILDGEEKTPYTGGSLTLTSSRLLWINTQQALQLDLKLVADVAMTSGLMSFMSRNVVVLTLLPRISGPGAGPANVKLVFNGRTDIPTFIRTMQTVLHSVQKSKAAAEAAAAETAAAGASDSVLSSGSSFLGIRGIIHQKKKELQESEQDIHNAFSDLKSLMNNAKEMVALVETYSARLKQQTEVPDAEGDELQQFAVSLGISAPVTHKTHGRGALFHCELARQLAGFLLPALEKFGGMLTLADAYCLFNRARGTYLVSPEDMLNACLQLSVLGLPVTYAELPSGVRVVQSSAYTLDEVAALVRDMLAARPFLTAADLAVRRGHSVVLCSEQLLALERAGTLCRDDTVHGLLFYPNRFLSGG